MAHWPAEPTSKFVESRKCLQPPHENKGCLEIVASKKRDIRKLQNLTNNQVLERPHPVRWSMAVRMLCPNRLGCQKKMVLIGVVFCFVCMPNTPQ